MIVTLDRLKFARSLIQSRSGNHDEVIQTLDHAIEAVQGTGLSEDAVALIRLALELALEGQERHPRALVRRVQVRSLKDVLARIELRPADFR